MFQHVLFYSIISGIHQFRRLQTKKASVIRWKNHILEMPLDIVYIWTLIVLAMGMMMNGWLYYLVLDSVIMEVVLGQNIEADMRWKLDNVHLRHDYLMAMIITVFSIFMPSVMELILHCGILYGMYYLDMGVVQPFLKNTLKKEE